MIKKLLLTSLLLLSCLAFTQAEGLQTIYLTDGSQIQGKLVGVNDGIYTIETPTLGTITLGESKVQGVSLGGVVPAQATIPQQTGSTESNPYAGQMQAMQAKMMSNPNMMADITAMMEDEELMSLLTDPAFMDAAQSGNINEVEGHPHLQQLMANPKMQALMQKMQGAQH